MTTPAAGFPDEAATVALCVPNPTSDPHGLLAFADKPGKAR